MAADTLPAIAQAKQARPGRIDAAFAMEEGISPEIVRIRVEEKAKTGARKDPREEENLVARQDMGAGKEEGSPNEEKQDTAST